MKKEDLSSRELNLYQDFKFTARKYDVKDEVDARSTMKLMHSNENTTYIGVALFIAMIIIAGLFFSCPLSILIIVCGGLAWFTINHVQKRKKMLAKITDIYIQEELN